jgi:diguanylate cyclase (GGDEF)-like protein/PAS domain S-box-containing protein
MEDKMYTRYSENIEQLNHKIQELEKLLNAQKKIIDELTKNNLTLQDFIENGSDLIQSIGPDGRFLFVNNAWKKTLGYSDDEIKNLTVFDIIHPDCIAHCKTIFGEIMQGKEVTNIETIFISKNGTNIIVEGNINTRFDDGRPLYTRGIFRNITDRKKLEEELTIAAITDRLTCIYNRFKLEDLLRQEIERARRYKNPFSLMMFDIDYFKRINDLFGHQKGDYVLKTIAHIVKNNIRTTDFFGRWGGEEFMILLPETSLDNAEILSEKIRTIVGTYHFEDIQNVTISCGVTEFIDGDTIDTLIKVADDALYLAKKQGRNKVVAWSR